MLPKLLAVAMAKPACRERFGRSTHGKQLPGKPETRPDEKNAPEDADEDVENGRRQLTALQQADRFSPEGRKRREPAEQTRKDEEARGIAQNAAGVDRPFQQSQQEATAQVYQDHTQRKLDRFGKLEARCP